MRLIKPLLILALLWPLSGHAGEKPSEWFCIKARAHRAAFASDKAAEDAARTQGASQDTIAKAKRCSR